MRFFVNFGWWIGVGIAGDREGVNLWLPFISIGVDW